MLIKARLDEGDETATTWTGLCSSKIMIFPLSATPLLPPLYHCPLHRPRYRLYCSLRCELLVLFHPSSPSPIPSRMNSRNRMNRSRIGHSSDGTRAILIFSSSLPPSLPIEIKRKKNKGGFGNLNSIETLAWIRRRRRNRQPPPSTGIHLERESCDRWNVAFVPLPRKLIYNLPSSSGRRPSDQCAAIKSPEGWRRKRELQQVSSERWS